jgi:hypothetical protein
MKRFAAIQAFRPAGLVILAFLSAATLSGFEPDKVLFEELKLGKTVVHNVQVVEANPVYVTITFDGASGSKIKRQELPPELKALYPYDAREAAEYEKKLEVEREQRVKEAKLRSEQASREMKVTLLRQQKSIKDRIAASESELTELDKEIKVLANKARRRPKSPDRAELNQARDRKLALLRLTSEQKSLLEKVEKNLILIP